MHRNIRDHNRDGMRSFSRRPWMIFLAIMHNDNHYSLRVSVVVAVAAEANRSHAPRTQRP
jgi:hypothetical protein